MYLLDTDVIIDFLKKKDPGLSVVKKLLQNKTFISIITWSEITYGIRKFEKSGKRAEEFDDFLNEFSIEVLPLEKIDASYFVDLKIHLERINNSLGDFDLLIASTCLSRDLTLVTRNIKHFSRINNLQIYE